MKKISKHVFLWLSVISGLWMSSTWAATLNEITSFGNNPGNLRMYLYVPDYLPNNVPILVAAHYCTGTGPAFYSGTQYASLADQYGFIVIYPSVTRSSQCFDVYSSQALTRNGGSDPVSIRSMISYVQQNYNVDSSRIFATGVSSGAMMTNVLLALYPDVFAAGAAFAGVPYTCFATTGGSTWNSDCSGGNVIRTAQEWGDRVRAAYPGYSGPYPRMQLWHGTADDTLRYPNFTEAVKQWTNVHGLSQTPTYTDSPQANATRTRYGSGGPQAPVEAISFQGTGHNLPVNATEAIRFFGLNGSVNSSSSSVASSSVSSSSTPASSSSSVISSSSSSAGNNSSAQCNWYGTLYPLCVTTPSGWGWENQRSCIANNTCSSQPAPYGVVGGTSSASNSSAPPASSSSAANSSVSGGQVCNWWGTRYPLCAVTQSGWGWENQTSCISRSTCSTQPSPYGITN